MPLQDPRLSRAMRTSHLYLALKIRSTTLREFPLVGSTTLCLSLSHTVLVLVFQEGQKRVS